MITGNILDSEKYCGVHKDLHTVFAFLLQGIKDCEQSVIPINERLCANVSRIETSDPKTRLFEAHRRYIDVHYIVSGEEIFGYSNVGNLKTANDYDPAGDCEMLSGAVNPLSMKAGDFCITFPEDAHIPFLEVIQKPLIRVVIKLPVETYYKE